MPERQGSRLFPSGKKLATEAPVNGGRNYDGPKVNNEFSSTRALVKFGYMLETLSIRRYVGATMLRRDNPFGAGNQQERPPRVSGGILRDHTPDDPLHAQMVDRRDGPSCMATCRGRRKRPTLVSGSQADSDSLKADRRLLTK